MIERFKRFLPYLAWIIGFELVAMYIGNVTRDNISGWYTHLVRPPLVPPNTVFPIVWTLLYICIACAGCRLWRQRCSAEGRDLMGLYFLQVGMNWAWSFIFFKYHALLEGLVWIALLNVITAILLVRTGCPDKVVFRLMLPVLLWTCFAMYLNGGYWYFNR